MKQRFLATLTILFCLAPLAAQTPDAKTKPLMKDFMGINAHTIQFPAKLYAPLCRLVRDYHNINWDIDDNTANATEGKLTLPRSLKKINWRDKTNSGVQPPHPEGFVDWEKLYKGWQAAGFEIDACLQINNLTLDKWKDPEKDPRAYGKAFAKVFGPSGKLKLVTSAEIGNEPAGRKRFSKEDYLKIFKSMSKGLREGDPKLKILTCTSEVDPDAYSMDLDIFKDLGDYYDVINVHKYAFIKTWPTWERSHPEDPTIEHLKVLKKTIAWRDKYAPAKPIWITEFGFDASTAPVPTTGGFKQFKCASDLQQAQWIVRSFLVFSEMSFERAYLYWFNDNNAQQVHGASGVTRKYKPKMSYWAMKNLYDTLGDYRFEKAVRKDAAAWVFQYAHGEHPGEKMLVVWSPTKGGKKGMIEIAAPGKILSAHQMPTTKGPAPKVNVPKTAAGKIKLPITESPIYLHVKADQQAEAAGAPQKKR